MWVALSKDPRLGNPGLAAWLPDPSSCIQWDYIVGYVSEYLGGTAFFIEREYVDRHYADEYLTHYARQFVAPAARTCRLHFFTGNIGALRETLPDKGAPAAGQPGGVPALNGSERFERCEDFLRQNYLGFVVLRPLEHAPVGRTLLRAPAENIDRCYSVPRIHAEVHLGPFRLSAEGVPFQSQDQVVGACASVALWSALAVAARHHGGRSPTPGDVTRAAQRLVRHATPGLDVSQAISAIESFGYSVEVFRPADFPGAHQDFIRMLLCHLRSRSPVMLWLDGTPAHAVVATGFRHTEQLDGPLTVYVHDDTQGPYARRLLCTPEDGENPQLRDMPAGGRMDMGSASIRHAVVVRPLKRKCSARDLLKADDMYRNQVERRWNQSRPGQALVARYSFELSGDYLRDIAMVGLSPWDRPQILHARLPREVGVVRYVSGRERVLDIVLDSTQPGVEGRPIKPLAILPYVEIDDPFSLRMRHFGEGLAIPVW